MIQHQNKKEMYTIYQPCPYVHMYTCIRIDGLGLGVDGDVGPA
jgi:hypothetical protein